MQGGPHLQRGGLLAQAHQQGVHRCAVIGLQCQDAGAPQLAQQRQAELVGAVTLELLRGGRQARIAVASAGLGGQLPAAGQRTPRCVDVARQLFQQGVDLFGPAWQQRCRRARCRRGNGCG